MLEGHEAEAASIICGGNRECNRELDEDVGFHCICRQDKIIGEYHHLTLLILLQVDKYSSYI